MTVNVNAPNGFQRFGLLDGASPTMGNQTRKVTSSSAIGFGDPVVSLGTGYIDIATAGTTQISGVFLGCYYLNTGVGRVIWSRNWPGSASATGVGTCYVDTDPNAIYVVQSDNTAITFADIDANINFVVGTPDAVGFSTSTVGQSTINTTNTLPFRIVGLLTDALPANSVAGTDNASAYNRVLVSPNYTDRKSLVGIV